MNQLPKSWIAAIAIVAAFGVLFVLITPAPDELPSTGPHTFAKAFVLLAGNFFPLSVETCEVVSHSPVRTFAPRGDLLSITCSRLC